MHIPQHCGGNLIHGMHRLDFGRITTFWYICILLSFCDFLSQFTLLVIGVVQFCIGSSGVLHANCEMFFFMHSLTYSRCLQCVPSQMAKQIIDLALVTLPVYQFYWRRGKMQRKECTSSAIVYSGFSQTEHNHNGAYGVGIYIATSILSVLGFRHLF
jgi:hypothetical protein